MRNNNAHKNMYQFLDTRYGCFSVGEKVWKSLHFHTFSPTERQPWRVSKNRYIFLCALLFRMFGGSLVPLASFFRALLLFSWFFLNVDFSPTLGIFRGKSAVSRPIFTIWGFCQYFLIKPIEILFLANFFGICTNFDWFRANLVPKMCHFPHFFI